jgi:hypothetical protein
MRLASLFSGLVALAACGGNPGASGDGGTGDDGGGGSDGMPDGNLSCPQDTWCVETSPVPATLLHGVYAINAGEVYAVGDNGTILRRRANVWTQMTSNTTSGLRAVWGADAAHVWAVGAAGTIDFYDGAKWTVQNGVTGVDLAGIWGSSPTDVWACASNSVFHWNGSQWAETGLGGILLSISGTGPSDVWTTGENTRAHHFTTAWDVGGLQNPGTGSNQYLSVTAITATNVWVTGAVPAKETVNFTGGTTWVPHATNGVFITSIYARAANDLWGAAQAGKIAHYDGATWTNETPAGVTAQLWSATGAQTHVWIVGDNSTILHRD